MQRIARPLSLKAPSNLGARLFDTGAEFAVYSKHGERVSVCMFDDRGEREIARWALAGRDGDIHHGFVPGACAGARYGLRVDGPNDPARGHRFDPLKLLADPYATRIDRPFIWRPELALARDIAVDTAPFMPRAIIEAAHETTAPAQPSRRPRFIYEVAVKALTKLHPDVPAALRGTIAGLADPRVIEHLVKLGVSHVELMPVTACMSEKHLVELGLENAWGYNPGLFMALDPRLAPNGMAELRNAVAALRAAGISTLLDVVFNHTAEGDDSGATLNLRGLDNSVYYRHSDALPMQLVNDTGCGNTLACARAPVVRLIVDSLRHFVQAAGVDGFRFDLAASLARGDKGFPNPHPLFEAISNDPILKDRVLIAEPWDIGENGYRLGEFPEGWLEWNDRSRDDTRRFWRGDHGAIGDFATRISGSADIFAITREAPSASVNFIAAHDGFCLADVVSYETKRNAANGESNRDGSNANFSWNRGVEGATPDARVAASRARDIRALLTCLFLARGTPMLTAGDELARSQRGNNNAYAQDNPSTWIDWQSADMELASFVGDLARLRAALAPLSEDEFLTGQPRGGAHWPDVEWRTPAGDSPRHADWVEGDVLCLVFCARDEASQNVERLFLAFNRSESIRHAVLPSPRSGMAFALALDSAAAVVDPLGQAGGVCSGQIAVPARGVVAYRELPSGQSRQF